jgi:hypothetical protein
VNEGEIVELMDFVLLAPFGWLAAEVAADLFFAACEWVTHG